MKLLVAVFVVVVLASAGVIPARAEEQCLVVPGASVGQWQLGMPLAKVLEAMGSSGEKTQTGVPGSYGLYFREKKIHFSFFKTNNTVSGITLYDMPENRACRTTEGIGIGSQTSDLDRFGKPEWSQTFPSGIEVRAYWSIGLYVELKDGTVRAIGAFDRNAR